MVERLAVSWEDASFAVISALALLFVSFVSWTQVGVEFVSMAGVEITAVIPLLGPIVFSIEDDDREGQDDDFELCGLPGVLLLSPLSVTIAQTKVSRTVSLSFLTPAQHPLRC